MRLEGTRRWRHESLGWEKARLGIVAAALERRTEKEHHPYSPQLPNDRLGEPTR